MQLGQNRDGLGLRTVFVRKTVHNVVQNKVEMNESSKSLLVMQENTWKTVAHTGSKNEEVG